MRIAAGCSRMSVPMGDCPLSPPSENNSCADKSCSRAPAEYLNAHSILEIPTQNTPGNYNFDLNIITPETVKTNIKRESYENTLLRINPCHSFIISKLGGKFCIQRDQSRQRLFLKFTGRYITNRHFA